MVETLISTSEAAVALGLTKARVQQMIWEGKLPARRVGKSWVIRKADLPLVEDRNPAGRPPKKK
jgi:excisionase family DNA binding protein